MFIFTYNYKRTHTPGYKASPSVVMVRDKYKVRVAAMFIIHFNKKFTDKALSFSDYPSPPVIGL